MKFTALLTTAAFAASTVTALTLPSQNQTPQPESLKIKIHKLSKREEGPPAVNPQDLQQAVADKCTILKGTDTEPSWCRSFESITNMCRAGPIETDNGLVYEISPKDDKDACHNKAMPILRDATGKVVGTLPRELDGDIREKCLEPEQEGDLMCREFLRSGKGEFRLHVYTEDRPDGIDLSGNVMIFGADGSKGVERRGDTDGKVGEGGDCGEDSDGKKLASHEMDVDALLDGLEQ